MYTKHEIRRWAVSLAGFFGLSGFMFSSWLGRLPAIRDHLDASTAHLSLLVLCPAVGSVIGFTVAARVLARVSVRTSLWAWLALQAVALTLATALLWSGGSSVIAAGVVMVCYGLGFGIHDVAINVNGGDVERAASRPLMPILHAAFSFGGLLALITCSIAERWSVAFPIHLGGVAVLVIGLSCIAIRQIPRTSPIEHAVVPVAASPERPARPYVAWRSRRVLLLGLLAASISLAEGNANDWLSLSLVDEHGFSRGEAALTLSSYFAAMTVSRLAGAYLLHRFGRVPMLRLTSLCCAIGVLTVMVSHVPALTVLGVVAWGIGSSLGYPVALSAAADNRVTATQDVAAVAAIAYTTMLLGPVLVGFLGEAVGMRLAFVPLLVIVLLGTLAIGAVRPPKRAV
ncbi:MFS transporter [Leucobacter komagatae]|uniref:MFS transporter n=1 Tax=Leucobacter komagatae TaxID=55969 RepID=UPI0006975A8B|nr:MFS transporter [Leucobacter komagatae]